MQVPRTRILAAATAALLVTTVTAGMTPSSATADPSPPPGETAVDALPAATEPAATEPAAAGRATGSGGLGFIGEYGTTNNDSAPALGEFNHPYDIAIDPRDGTSLIVSDSGNVNWGLEGYFSQSSGHSLQWLQRTAEFDAERGQYRSGGVYDLTGEPSDGFGGNFAFTQIKHQRTDSGTNLGPRGVAISPAGEVFFTASQLSTLSGSPGQTVRRLAPDGTELGSFGSWQNGLLSWSVGVDLDAEGLVYVSSQDGYTVNGNLGSIVVYTQDGELVSSYPGPEIPLSLGVVVGDSSPDRVELWALSSPGSTARVVKLIAQKGGGDEVPGRNPAGWVWEVDPTFESVQLSGQHFTLSADLDRGEIYAMPRTGLVRRIDAQTGANLGTLGARGSSATPGQYAMSRGAAADADGYLHVSTESGTTGYSALTRVQVFANTPDPVTGLTVDPSHDSVSLTWDPLPVGTDTPYGQAQLRDYVVEYREAGGAEWTTLEADAPSTKTHVVVPSLTPETDYEFRVTPFNEAGSGDAAEAAATTEKTPGPGALSIEKLGDGDTATEDNPVKLEAGTEVTFEYRVTNTGESTVTSLALSDDQIGDVEIVSSVEPGDTVTATATDEIAAGSYTNVATVTGETLGDTVEATAKWFAVGESTEIDPPTVPPTTPPGEGGNGDGGSGGDNSGDGDAGDGDAGDGDSAGGLSDTGGQLPVALLVGGLALVATGVTTVVLRRRLHRF